MQVRATQRGFYGKLREEGDVFDVADKKGFSERWMEPVKAKAPDKKPDPPAEDEKTSSGTDKKPPAATDKKPEADTGKKSQAI